MLISRVSDEGQEECGGQGAALPGESPALQVADDLFELMAKDSRFDPDKEDTLTQRDLVLLYKNLDLGTQLMSNASVQRPRPNQRVETIVYKGKEEDSEDSDISPVNSNEDLRSLYLMNKDKSRAPSYTLCNKFGDLDINTSDLTVEYKRKFLFRDPYVKTQLQSINLFSSSSTLQGIVPTSLLDYICCKRLEDNYNFYMDNIIKYVQHTIEQLKRISNGDYLTQKVKEKWREVEKRNETSNSDKTKVLATSTSIPLHVERKITGHKSRWDDIVHSEVDIRSLSRILEKKIVIEIPKLISGSYKILSKCCVDNLLVSCTNTKLSQVSEKTDSRVDVVFELKRSDSGHVISDISSIMIVQTLPCETNIQISANENLPLTYLDKAAGSSAVSSITQGGKSLHLIPIEEIFMDSSDVKEESRGSASEGCTSHKIIELKDGSESSQIDIFDSKDGESESSSVVKYLSKNISAGQFSTTLTSNDTEYKPAKDESQSDYNEHSLSATQPDDLASEKSLNRDQTSGKFEANFDFSPDELGSYMWRLGVQGTLKEESEEDPDLRSVGKKKSQTKVRVKSPYENQSFVVEEKRRKRLLEIRERRERKKLAMQEFCKIVKNSGKSFAMPQASSSVTKLSITNKSFYNSIYGQNSSAHNKQTRNKAHRRSHKRSLADAAAKKSSDGEHLDLSLSSMNSDRYSNKKFINRSYYLDEVETEMMNMDNDDDTERKEDSTARSDCNDFHAELDMLSKLMNPTGTVEIERLNTSEVDVIPDKDSPEEEDDDEDSEVDKDAEGSASESLSGAESGSSSLNVRARLNVTPEPRRGSGSSLSPNGPGNPGPERSFTSLDCRRSIERVYDLMKRLGKTDCFPETRAAGRFPSAPIDQRTVTRSDSATNPVSDSGTSLKHLSSSCQSFVTNNAQRFVTRSKQRRADELGREGPRPAAAPRRRDRNKPGKLNVVGDKTPDVGGDPMKTNGISRLSHDIDSLPNNPKATKQLDAKPTRSLKSPADETKTSPRQNNTKKTSPKARETYVVPPEFRPRKRPVPLSLLESKIVVPRMDRFAKRKIVDIIDEEKEARGEAVRGPSKCRINELAQPRKTYVQAQMAEVQNKYGRSAISDRLQRLAGGPLPSPANPKSRPLRKIVPETLVPQSPRHGPQALRTADPGYSLLS